MILLIFLSYLIGSIPFAYILTLTFGDGDIRKIGSGNVGATNVLRTGKKSLALLVLLLDISKGFLVLFFLLNLNNEYKMSEYAAVLIASFSIAGHIFPIWLRFKGGKGVATYIGFLLALSLELGVIFIFSWLFIAILKKYSSLSSLVSLIIIPLIALTNSYDTKLVFLLVILSFAIILKHKNNIKRLLQGSESKIKF